MRRVCIGSTNPVKTAAAKTAFAAVFPGEEFEFVGGDDHCHSQLLNRTVNAPSGVSDQPMSDAETLQGARSRVANAMKEARHRISP